MKKIFSTILILLFTLIGFSFAQTENKAFLTGLAIVEDVGEDEYGLTVLDGFFSITNFKKLPSADFFKVYSRWTGIGEHKVRAQIVDPENTIIEKTEDEDLIFDQEQGTYFFIHDFGGIVFQKPGVYWVQAVLDNEVQFEMPLFIQLSGEEVEYTPESNVPYLTLSVPAIEVYEKENGLLSVSGAFEYFVFENFPAEDSFIIANAWCSGDGEFTQHIEILDPDNNILFTSEPQAFENGPKTINLVYDEIQDLVFPKPGIYTIRVYLEEKPVFEYPLIVIEE